MRILVTNDDGIHSPGLDVLEEVARSISDDVWVIAPEYDQSGVAHSLSLNDPLRLRQVGENKFAVKGTPTDCVILGARHVMAGSPPEQHRDCDGEQHGGRQEQKQGWQVTEFDPADPGETAPEVPLQAPVAGAQHHEEGRYKGHV